MTTQMQLRAALQRLRRRAWFDAGLALLLRAVAGASLLVAVLATMGRRWSQLDRPLLEAAVAGAVGAGAVVMWLIRRPSVEDAARTADARLRLDERLATAMTTAAGSTSLQSALLADAAAVAQAHLPGSVYPLRRHRRGLPGAIVAVAVAATALLLARGAAQPATASPAPDDAIRSHAADVIRQQLAINDSLPGAAGDPQRAGLHTALKGALGALERAQASSQVLETLSALGDQLPALQDPQIAAQVAAAAAAGAALQGSALTADIGRSLAAGDLAGAAADLRGLAQNLGGLDRQQLDQAAQALKHAAQAAPPQSDISAALSSAATALSPDLPSSQAAQKLDTSAASLDRLGQRAADQNLVAGARAAVDAARRQAANAVDRATGGSGGEAAQPGGAGQPAASGQPGAGAGADSGGAGGAPVTNGGAAGSQSGGGAGGGSGAGSGGGGGQAVPTQTGTAAGDSIFVSGQTGVPQIDDQHPTHLAPGQSVPLVDLRSVLAAFERASLEALDRAAVSPGDRDLVRDYFTRLGGEG